MSPTTLRAEMPTPYPIPQGPWPPQPQPPGPHDPPSPPPKSAQRYAPSSLFPGMISLWPEETCFHGFHGAVAA